MSNFTIDRDKFRELLSQFRGDIAYQTELVETLLAQMPDNYVDELIKTKYYERIFIGTYYIVQHVSSPATRYIFLSYAEVMEFLASVSLEPKCINKFILNKAIGNGTPINGYTITKFTRSEVNNA